MWGLGKGEWGGVGLGIGVALRDGRMINSDKFLQSDQCPASSSSTVMIERKKLFEVVPWYVSRYDTGDQCSIALLTVSGQH